MDWASWRRAFPVTDQWTFLDHAAVAPIPAATHRAMRDGLDEMLVRANAQKPNWNQRIERVRASAARLLGAETDEVALTTSTSAGISFVAEGLAWRRGDNVVTAAEEFPSNLYPWQNLSDRGVSLRRVPTHDGRIRLEDIAAAMDERTRVVSLSWVEFGSGFRHDLPAIGELCRQRGARFLVDAIQGLGAFPIDVHDSGIDFLAADGHKWLCGPEGAAVFYVRRDRLDELHTTVIGWNSVADRGNFDDPSFQLRPEAARWEPGSPNLLGLIGLGSSIDLLLEAGITAIAERIIALTDRLCEVVETAGGQVASSRRPGDKSGIVAFELPGVDSTQLVKRLVGDGIIVSARHGRVRVSPHFYNAPEDLDRLTEGIGRHRDACVKETA